MRLRHATPRTNLDSIMTHGLDPARSRSPRKVVWLHTASRTPWARLHTMQRHDARLEDVAILDVDVPRGWLSRAQRGLWICGKVIPSDRLSGIGGPHEADGISVAV